MSIRFATLIAAALVALVAGCAWRSDPAPAPAVPRQASQVFDLDPERFGHRETGRLQVTVAWPAPPVTGTSRAVQAFPATTTSFLLTVSASDMVAVQATIARPQGAATASTTISVPAGTGRSLQAEGLNSEGRTTARGATGSLTVTPGSDTAVRVQLATIVGDVQGTVANLGTGLPAASISVAAGGATTSTDASGSYVLRDVPSGTQILQFNAGPILSQPVVVQAGAIVDAEPVGVSLAFGRSTIRRPDPCSGILIDFNGVHSRSATESFAWGRDQFNCGFDPPRYELMRTTNGGGSWERVLQGADLIEDLYFGSSSTGFFVAANGGLYRSQDSGVTWANVTQVSALRVHAFDANTLIAGKDSVDCPNPAALNLSVDGGASIAQCRKPPVTMTSLAAINQSVLWTKSAWGLLLGDFVFRSLDGGASWTSERPGVRAYTKYALAAASAGNAVVVGEGGPADGTGSGDGIPTIAETVDGGTSWQTVFRHTQAIGRFEAVSRLGTGWIAVRPDLVAVRYPGATNWATMAVPGHALRAVSFAGTSGGWAVGDGGAVVKF